jgi:2-desacetyl-2-hydroxyethyl bacteriochlorophyllide A dehydrogenase
MSLPAAIPDEIDALVCVNPGELRLERRAAPTRSEGEILVRPRRIGICGTDYHIYEGKHPFLQYPRVMGHELAVEVIEAPSGSSFAPGEICVVNPYLSCGTCIACRAGKPNACVKIAVLGVHRDGGMTSLLSLPQRNLIKAEGLDADACASVEFLAIGAHAVSRAQVGPGDRVLVVGAGPIGLGAALFAKLSKGAVTLLDLDAGRLASIGAILDVNTIAGGEGVMDAVAALTAGEGFDVVFDATGNARSMERAFDFVAPGGRYVFVSVVKGPISFEDPDFHRRELTLFGSRNAVAADFERVIAAIRSGDVPIDKIITHRTTLEGAIRDLPLWATDKGGLIKALIEID